MLLISYHRWLPIVWSEAQPSSQSRYLFTVVPWRKNSDRKSRPHDTRVREPGWWTWRVRGRAGPEIKDNLPVIATKW